MIVGGTEISRLNDDKLTDYRRGDIGFVFQFYNLVPNLTVASGLDSSLSCFPMSCRSCFAEKKSMPYR